MNHLWPKIDFFLQEHPDVFIQVFLMLTTSRVHGWCEIDRQFKPGLNHGSWAKSRQAPDFLNTVLLAHSHAH